ncbi:hypothetical protein [Mesorhizobium sp. CA12]|uniref:hypothetical protein n=1 Tax=Mesorhizobium sp. CA12 TaxID=2876644 RepID=UPI001CC9C64F|nr:hypothetical protein [Mesorhizobium sp. CA12]MBZ9860858.1 hypothetical protein [Mesorhizobium sp. CA12]
MAKTEADIVAFLKSQAESNWQSSQEPFLLSQATPALKAAGLDYKAILGEERLKAFVKRTEDQGGYRLVSHPVQKPKVGVVPAGENFEFQADDLGQGTERPSHRRAEAGMPSDYSSRAIIRAFARLSDEELDQIVIPTRVFVKLLGGR